MREVGLHLRSKDSFSGVLEKAVTYNLSFFQCFLLHSKTGKHMQVNDSDIKAFRRYREQHLQHLYVHGSYWINLSDTKRRAHPVLNYEIQLAKKLSFTHIVLHPGAVPGKEAKAQGINALARSLNTVMKSENKVTIVLENTAHGNRSIGGDIHDFRLLLDKLDYPDRIQFCIDTAHAFAYGYKITTEKGRQQFITTIESTIGIDAVALIHVNDSMATCGSKIDQHALINHGYIKEEALKSLVLHEKLKHIPLILELPVITDLQEVAMLQKVCGWHTQ